MPFLNVPLSYRCLSFPPLHFKRRLNDLWTLIFLGKQRHQASRQCNQNNGKEVANHGC